MSVDFDAFISYRRQDAQLVAGWLHRALHNYQRPPELREGRQQPLRVSMDVLYESATENFWENTLEPRLVATRRLIVVSSPTSREILPGDKPNWLVREIQTYLGESREPKISIVIGAGEFAAPLPADLHVRYPLVDRVDLRSSQSVRAWRYAMDCCATR